MASESTSNANEQLLASGLSIGETILIPEVKKSADSFMILFHELGHNLDKQFDIKEILKPISQIKTETISLSMNEARWLLEESQTGWQSTGITEHHKSITRKLLKAILVDGTEVKSNIRSMSTEEFNAVVSKARVTGSQKDENTGKLQIVDEKIHRNSEVPADFISELMIDVFNRSINKHFFLQDTVRIFTIHPDERNRKTTDIARYLIKRNWNAPGFYSQQVLEEQ